MSVNNDSFISLRSLSRHLLVHFEWSSTMTVGYEDTIVEATFHLGYSTPNPTPFREYIKLVHSPSSDASAAYATSLFPLLMSIPF